MYALLRPLLFSMSPTSAHAAGNAALGVLERVGPLRTVASGLMADRDPRSRVRAMGLDFPSPVGLAGGFDKNAARPKALASLGFGFLELGTVTARAQEPNPEPNLFRLPADRALINRLGFPNEGAAAVVARFVAGGGRSAAGVPVGFSIGKSRSVDVDEDPEPVVADYLGSFRAVAPVSDFVVINVSSPNTKNLRALQGPELARALLGALARENAGARPLLLKIAPDLSNEDLDALLDVVGEVGLTGVVATNTTIRREGLSTPSAEVEAIGAGGLSGPPLRVRALEVVSRVRRKLGRAATIIGVGGVSSGEDARAMLDAGANLVQIYTAFIYRGPTAARDIERERLAAHEAHRRV